jgi:hypothetical protein
MREGRLPAIVRARCRVDQARFWVRLPSGLLVEDLAAARTVLAVSCGATDVSWSATGRGRTALS